MVGNPRSLTTFVLYTCAVISLLLVPISVSAKTLVLAQISERPKKDFKELRPMVTYMAKHLESLGFTDGEVRLFKNTEALINAIENGKIHWVTETAKTAAIIVNRTKSSLLLSKWKNQQQSYASVIYTRADSGINTIDDLRGKVIAFENQESFSSYYLPRMMLESKGMKLRAMASLRQHPTNDEVGYVFSRNEKNNVLWTAKKLVDVGVINDGDWNNADRLPAGLKSQLKMLYRSKQFPRALEIVTPALSPQATKIIKQTLLKMTVNNSGGVLARYEQSSGFSVIPKGYRAKLDKIYARSVMWEAQ